MKENSTVLQHKRAKLEEAVERVEQLRQELARKQQLASSELAQVQGEVEHWQQKHTAVTQEKQTVTAALNTCKKQIQQYHQENCHPR